MKVLAFYPERCVGCHICEEVCSNTWFKVTDREKSSIRIHDDGEGLLSATYCVQQGDCIAVCPVGALTRNKQGIVMLRKKQCVGCMSCVGFCPHLAMFHHPDQSEPFKCVACGKCVEACPADALAIVEVDAPSPPGPQA